MSFFKIEGVAVVTGAAGGIGLAAANAFAEAGASVVIFTDIQEDKAKANSEQSKSFAANPEYKTAAYHVDVTDPQSVDDAIAKIVAEFGRIDYLVNSAGVDTERYVPVPENDMQDYDKVMAVNSKGMLISSRAVIKVMEKQEPRTFTKRTGATRDLGRGVIVNITSVLSFAAQPGKVAYITSKHAAIGITKSLAMDVAAKGIRVNAICPGWVNTPMHHTELQKIPQIIEFIKRAVPIGRVAEPEEIGENVVALCTPAGTYINGAPIIIDAGLTLTVNL